MTIAMAVLTFISTGLFLFGLLFAFNKEEDAAMGLWIFAGAFTLANAVLSIIYLSSL